jgi:glycosyltransferase involved in cell wall biosynthesis
MSEARPVECIIIPVFNHGASVARTAAQALATGLPVVVVDDGSTDGSLAALAQVAGVHALAHAANCGKGAAIQTGLRWARERGHARAITLDADGQHDPADAGRLLAAGRAHPAALIIGERDLKAAGAPFASRLGSRLSNAWFRLLSGRHGADTQSGFRSYRVAETLALGIEATGYDFEFEALLRSVRAGIPLVSVPVRVAYPSDPGERISHFRPFRDSARIAGSSLRCRFSAGRRAGAERSPSAP